MAKMLKNGRSKKKYPPFVMLPFKIIESPAWASLSAHAQALWPHIKKRYRDFNEGNNNGEIPFSVREAAIYLNCSKGRAKKALDELTNKGFLQITRNSVFSQKCRHSREWAITSERLDGKDPTNEWQNYKSV